MAAPMSHFHRRLNTLLAISRAATLLVFTSTVKAVSDCPTGFVNFGSSYTDTGNFLSFFPYSANADFPPYGQTFFGKPSKRFCNGRLVPDFFALAFSRPLLDPYVKATSFQYQFGINFAEEGAAAIPPFSSPINLDYPPAQPKSLASVYPVQLNQFKRFFDSVVATENQTACEKFNAALPLPTGTSWVSQWLYTIEAGTNDLLNVFRTNIQKGPPVMKGDRGQSPLNSYIVDYVFPKVQDGIVQTIKELYGVGARKFLVFGIPAIGCSTELLTLFADTSAQKDRLGCLQDVNDYAQLFNKVIAGVDSAVRRQLPRNANINIAFFDYFAAHKQILTTPTAFGFTNTFSACCGARGRGKFNYNPDLICGSPGATVCATPETYVNWDGEHYTDLFYKIISIFALYGVFTDNGINYATSGCFLDFTKFTDTFTFNEVYPSTCQTIFV